MKPGDAIGSFTSRAGVVRVRNALNPMLWTTAVVFPTSLLAAYFFRDDDILKYALAAFGAFPVLVTIIAYFIFLFRDPDRLQSEEYLLQHQAMQILYKKDAVTESVEVITEAPRLEVEPSPGEKKP
ncbi:hypothetical protein SS37A_11340 [Methylocystis iwaonis]|uniref:Uncharacterized protein n=2 Tax=Methylocystis iwaonis TaxID=2885079 RepID=A0ABN6VEI8_9HYPH|nr:hypothetical protein [Methylocystis iwaonis]BDV33605.1 hypothetical protein SS37A_11340 [Methylocystis iwaonis]